MGIWKTLVANLDAFTVEPTPLPGDGCEGTGRPRGCQDIPDPCVCQVQCEAGYVMGEDSMERPRGLEPPPTAWQAVVLPLYYGRSAYAFYSTGPARRQARPQRQTGTPRPSFPCSSGTGLWENARGLVDLGHARRLYHRRLLLPFGELRRFGAVRVHPREFLAVMVIDGNLPVPMLAPLVFPELGSFSFSQGLLSRGFLRGGRRTMAIWPAAHKYQDRN